MKVIRTMFHMTDRDWSLLESRYNEDQVKSIMLAGADKALEELLMEIERDIPFIEQALEE